MAAVLPLLYQILVLLGLVHCEYARPPYISGYTCQCRIPGTQVLNSFRTAVPFWGQTTRNLTGLSPHMGLRLLKERVKLFSDFSTAATWRAVVSSMYRSYVSPTTVKTDLLRLVPVGALNPLGLQPRTFCFPGVLFSGGMRMLVLCVLPLFYYRGISSTPEL